MTPDIFLSYTREDVAVAQAYRDAFAREGLDVWWDASLRSGETYDEVTEAALRAAKAVVVLWSPRSVASGWVRAEATIAHRNKTLAPVMIEPCERPVMFELTQTADLSHWTGEVTDPAWRTFLVDVRRFVETGATPTAARPAAAPGSAPSRRSPRPFLAVLPFINRSGREEDDVFADGMVEDLTAALSGNPRLKVIGSRATAVYRNAAVDLRQIGRDLAVRYLLEGNIRRVGGDLRVTAQLVEGETGGIVWTQKFDRPLAELSALQDDLVAEVAAHLGVQVLRAEIDHAARKQGAITAYEAMRRSQLYTGFGTRAGAEAAVAEAKRAAELDPGDGALAWLAAVQGHLLHLRGGDDAELAHEAMNNIGRARALDPNNPEVLSGTALALAWLGEPQEALPLAKRAVAANPQVGLSRYVLGLTLAMLGRSDEAIVEMEAVERLAPDSPLAHRSWKWRSIAQLQAGRFDQALQAADQGLQLLSEGEALIQSALCLANLGDWDRAREVTRRLRQTDPELSYALAAELVRGLYCGSHAADEYVAIVRELWDEASSEAQSQ
jgi:TolB-like protein/Flp pilus assembly protein TadD